MFSEIFKEITGYLDKRFLVAFFLPCLLFLAVLAGLGILLHGPADPVAVWMRQTLVVQAGGVILFLAAAFFFASVLANYSLSLTRLYEGYWSWKPLHWLARLRIAHYQRRIRAMKRDEEVLAEALQWDDGSAEESAAETRWRSYKKAARDEVGVRDSAALVAKQQATRRAREAFEQAETGYLAKLAGSTVNARTLQVYGSAFYYLFPVSDIRAVMPTRLGNILKSAETYPLERYGIDSVLLWPRIASQIPETFAQSLAETSLDMDRMLVLSFLAVLLALIGGPYLLWAGGPSWLFLLLFWGGLLAGRLSYEAALAKAMTYGELIRAAYDLYRGAALTALGYEAPQSHSEEKERWAAVSQFLLQNAYEAARLPLLAASETKEKTTEKKEGAKTA